MALPPLITAATGQKERPRMDPLYARKCLSKIGRMPTIYHCFMVLFPKTNGKAERFIQTLLRAWPYARIYVTSNEWMADLPIF